MKVINYPSDILQNIIDSENKIHSCVVRSPDNVVAEDVGEFHICRCSSSQQAEDGGQKGQSMSIHASGSLEGG